MPYIKQGRRDVLMNYEEYPVAAGELNYVLTTVVRRYWAQFGHNYQTINDIIGALECAKQEFYRRVVAPYEDEKIKENGDV